MKLKKAPLIVLLAGFAAFSAFAAPSAPKPVAPAPEPTAEDSARNHDEDWYWGFNLGGGSTKYTNAANQSASEALKATPGISHSTLYFDLHFLWPVANGQTAIGIGAGGVSDTYNQEATSTKKDVITSLLTFSAHHYFMSNVGDGLFGRAEIGFASAKSETTIPGFTAASETKRGTGIRLGMGYSLLLSNETRLPVTILWQHTNLKDESGSNAVLFTAGLLF